MNKHEAVMEVKLKLSEEILLWSKLFSLKIHRRLL